MKTRRAFVLALTLGAVVASPAFSQNESADGTTQSKAKSKKAKKGRSAGGDIGSGSGNIASGAGKGAGHAAEGVGKGAADLATLHPVGAATDLGKGGVTAGKDVAVGTTKGTAKVVKGIGKGIKHIF